MRQNSGLLNSKMMKMAKDSHREKIAREQTAEVKWVQDPHCMEMHRKTSAERWSMHQLPKWLSNRPQWGPEKFHECLAHLANTGPGKELADALALAGMADHNARARQKKM
jgi:hypothetical protein